MQFFLYKVSFSRNLRAMDVRAENRGRPHQEVHFPVAPAMGRSFLTPGHPGVRVRTVRRKFGPKSFGGNFGPDKKYFSLPPPKLPANTLPAPQPPAPLLSEPPPVLGFSTKTEPSPPYWHLRLPPLPPSRKTKKNPKRPPSNGTFPALTGLSWALRAGPKCRKSLEDVSAPRPQKLGN